MYYRILLVSYTNNVLTASKAFMISCLPQRKQCKGYAITYKYNLDQILKYVNWHEFAKESQDVILQFSCGR